MNVHYLQHVPFEGLGYIETWLRKQQYPVTATRFYDSGYHLPGPGAIDALVIMGGPMSVYDEDRYPWLREEKRFIKDCILAGKKILGICLGAQLVAECLGGRVSRAKHKEIGWFPLKPTEAGRQVPGIYQLFENNPVVFHWHGEQFTIPGGGSLHLLSSEANDNQAFYYNENIIGLQFHLEVTEDTVMLMLQHGMAELTGSAYVQAESSILAGMNHISLCNDIMDHILTQWLVNRD